MSFNRTLVFTQEPLPDATPPPPIVREDGYEISMDEDLLNIKVDRTQNKTNTDTDQIAAKTSDYTVITDMSSNEVKKDLNSVDKRDNESKQDPSFDDHTKNNIKTSANNPIQVNSETEKDTPETDTTHIQTKIDIKQSSKGTVDTNQTNTGIDANGNNSQAENAFLPSMKDAFLGNVPYLIEGSEYHGLDGRYMAVDRNADTVLGDDKAEGAAAGASEAEKAEDNVPHMCVYT